LPNVVDGLGDWNNPSYDSNNGPIDLGAIELSRTGGVIDSAVMEFGAGRVASLGPLFTAEYQAYLIQTLHDGSLPDATEMFMRAIEWTATQQAPVRRRLRIRGLRAVRRRQRQQRRRLPQRLHPASVWRRLPAERSRGVRRREHGRHRTDASGSESTGTPDIDDELGGCGCATDDRPARGLWMLVGLLGLGVRRRR